jgi:hypothetical protein
VPPRSFNPRDPFPADFPNALGQFLSTAAIEFVVRIKASDATVLEVPAGTGNDQVGIGVEGRWRYNSATVERASPGGGTPRTLDVYVTGTDNVFVSGPDGEVDNTDYAFALAIVEHNATPAGVAIKRLVATATWDGTKFTDVSQVAGAWRPSPRTGWTVPANLSSLRSIDTNSLTINDLADYVATLEEDLVAVGVIAR